MSADNVRGWEIVRKMNIWPRSEASRANMKFWGQSLSQWHYQPAYQQAGKGFIYFISLPLIYISYLNRSQKASVDMKTNGCDCWERVNLIGSTLSWLDQNLTSCDVKCTLAVSHSTWCSLTFWFVFCWLRCHISDQLSNVTVARQKKIVFLPCKIMMKIETILLTGLFSTQTGIIAW